MLDGDRKSLGYFLLEKETTVRSLPSFDKVNVDGQTADKSSSKNWDQSEGQLVSATVAECQTKSPTTSEDLCQQRICFLPNYQSLLVRIIFKICLKEVLEEQSFNGRLLC